MANLAFDPVATAQAANMAFTGFFAYKRNLYFPKEFVVLGGIFWGATLEVIYSLTEEKRILAELRDRLSREKPVIDDPHWKFPKKVENSVYEAMGFKSWRNLHKKALGFAIIKEDSAFKLTITYPGNGQVPGPHFEINCGHALEDVFDHVKKHAEIVFGKSA